MKRFLLDSDICIDFLRGLTVAGDFVRSAPSGSLVLSVVTDMELVAGCRDQQDRQRVDTLVRQFPILPIKAEDSVLARQLLRRYRLEAGIGLADSLIAATALNRGLRLLTRNLKHYQPIKGLDAAAPY